MLEALFLGLVQGLTEFLPISSSAHLRIIGEFLPSAQDPGAAFTAIIQIGTELAVLIFFRVEIASIIRNFLRISILRKESYSKEEAADNKLGWWIIIGSLPIFIFGFLFQDSIKTTFRSLTLIAITLILFALILGVADYFGESGKGMRDLKARDALLLGLGQSLALIPGVSRSGMTIAVGRSLGYNRSAATKISFFLAIPAVLGSGIYQLYQTLNDPSSEVFTLTETFAATLVSFVVGYAVIAWLMKFISKASFRPFVAYRVALGGLVLLGLSLNFF
ncbi:MAG: undecaprenyl-diphosphatase UppP [Candidatus Nanopelagicaceae bacterium]